MNKHYFFLFLLIFCSTLTYSQNNTSSPYSRYGLGSMHNNIISSFVGMGGGSTAIFSEKYVNPYNPSSYSAFSSNSFILSTGLNHLTTEMQTSDLNQTTNNTSFSHLIFGFHVSNKIGASFGIVPFSSTGYNIKTRDKVYNTNNLYYGSGGLSKMFFGGSYKLDNNFSFGANAAYLFGGYDRSKQVVFDNNTIFSSRSNSRINIKGYYYEFGVTFNKKINKNLITLALATNNSSTLDAKRNLISYTYENNGLEDLIKDTTEVLTERGDIIVPKNLSGGFSILIDEKWFLVSDLNIQNWKSYKLLGETDSLKNSFSFSTGIEYRPRKINLNGFLSNLNYRLGFTLNKTPLNLNNYQLKENSISLGIGIPNRKSRTIYDLSVVLGYRGTTENSLIKEEFIKLALNITFNGRWFVKRKYN